MQDFSYSSRHNSFHNDKEISIPKVGIFMEIMGNLQIKYFHDRTTNLVRQIHKKLNC
jgi:hypothetical protein